MSRFINTAKNNPLKITKFYDTVLQHLKIQGYTECTLIWLILLKLGFYLMNIIITNF